MRSYQQQQENQERQNPESVNVLLSPLKINSGSREPRPILSAIIGMLQKLSTVSLERADARSRISLLLLRCLPMLPKMERTHFLKFFVKLVKSKKSTHRLFATEVAGKLLIEDWLWLEHLDGGRPTDSVDLGDVDGALDDDTTVVSVSTTTTATSHSTSNLYNIIFVEGLGERDPARCVPLNIFQTLNGRLSDKVPGVRARAAQSLSECMACALKSTKKKNASFWIKSAARSNLGMTFSASLRKRAEVSE